MVRRRSARKRSRQSRRRSSSHKGKIFRKGYTRKAYTRRSPSGKVIRVKSARIPGTWIKDRGAPGKGLRSPSGKRLKGIGKLKKGELSKYGYDVNAPAPQRHAALERSARDVGWQTTQRRVRAPGIYEKRTAPSKSERFIADANWVSETLG